MNEDQIVEASIWVSKYLQKRFNNKVSWREMLSDVYLGVAATVQKGRIDRNSLIRAARWKLLETYRIRRRGKGFRETLTNQLGTWSKQARELEPYIVDTQLDRLDDLELERKVRNALGWKYRLLIRLVIDEGMSYDAIGELYGLTHTRIGQWMIDAKARIDRTLSNRSIPHVRLSESRIPRFRDAIKSGH